MINEEGSSNENYEKPKYINELPTEVDVKGNREIKVTYVYKSPFKERLIDFKPSLTAEENIVCEWLFSLQGNPE